MDELQMILKSNLNLLSLENASTTNQLSVIYPHVIQFRKPVMEHKKSSEFLMSVDFKNKKR
jgi:hypothetical protein